MFKAIILGLTMLTTLSYAQNNTKDNNSLKTLNSFVSSEIGFNGVVLENVLPDIILEKIKKEDWSKVRSKISALTKDKIKIGKLTVSDNYGLEINFFYSSYSTNFEINISVKSDEDVSNIKKAIQDLCSYSALLIKDLYMLSSETIYGAVVRLKNMDTNALNAMLNMDNTKMLQNQAYYIISELEKNETAKTKIQKILSDDDSQTDQEKIDKIKKVLTKKDLYKGELRLFVNLDASYVISSLTTIINTSSADYVKPTEESLSAILEYHELVSHFHDFIFQIDKDSYSYVFINMKESASKSYYDGDTFTLYLNIEDLFYNKADLTKK